jgi:hypothetical protein
VFCQRHGTTGGIKQLGTQSTSENGRGARVALCAHYTHTNTEGVLEPGQRMLEQPQKTSFISVFVNYALVFADGRCRGSSVSIVSDYGLDDRVIGVRSGTKNFSSNLCVQTGSDHPASCTMGTGGPFPGAKRGRGVTLTTHPHLVPRSRMSRSYTSSPPKLHHGGTVLLFLFDDGYYLICSLS